MLLIEKLKWRLSPQIPKIIKWYRVMIKSENDLLSSHLNDYFFNFKYSLLLGRYYKTLFYFTYYGFKRLKKERNFLHPNKLEVNLTKIYKSKNISRILRELNGSEILNEFEIYNLRFKFNRSLHKLLFVELKDLIIPYMYNRQFLYNSSLLGEGTYETEDVYVSEDDVVIDVGANMGVFSIFSVVNRKASRVYAFEPIKSTFDILISNCKLNDIQQNVDVINMGLGNFNGTASMSISEDNIGANSMVLNLNGNLESVEITTLDSFVTSNEIKKLDFIKVDIEGAERLFLEGDRKSVV
jgi:FkbM family methyltransferase